MNNYKIILPRSIAPLLLLAVALNIFRILLFGKLTFIYILWNIFLAFIPFIISSLLLSYIKREQFNKIIFSIGLLLWILFIPNAPYIVTDFIHLGEIRSVPVIYDIFLIFSSSLLGLLLGFNSLFHIEQIMKIKYSTKITSIIMGIIILLISFGIYLGRFLRFNSWDVFISHTALIKNVWRLFSQSSNHIEVYLYTFLFFICLVLSYKSWKYSNTK